MTIGSVKKMIRRGWRLLSAEYIKRYHYDASLIASLSHVYGIPDIDFYYDKQFFSQRSPSATVGAAALVVDVVLEHFSPRTVVDIGCGNGNFVKAFQDRGIDAWGIEGSRAARGAAVVDPNCIRIFDLREVLRIENSADLCICFEVLEHIGAKHADQVVANIVGAANELLVTAAPPGQGGRYHVNEQPYQYWISKFEIHGLRFDETTTQTLRKQLDERGALSWLADNMMAFRQSRPVEPSRHWQPDGSA